MPAGVCCVHRLRLLLAILIFSAFCLVFGILWMEIICLQALTLVTLLLLCLMQLGWRKTWKQLKLIAPFALSLLLMYGILVLLGIAPRDQAALAYWTGYGLLRLLLLVSSLLAFRLCVSLLSYEGLLRSAPNIHWQKYLILGRILYEAAFRSYPRLKAWQDLIPSSKLAPRGFKGRFNRALASSLALALYVMEEARRKGELIDNRIEHCYKELS